jgi:hypothetical protein
MGQKVENVEATYNTYNLGEQWLERELQQVNFGDKRLLKTTSLIEGKASGSINQSCGTRHKNYYTWRQIIRYF